MKLKVKLAIEAVEVRDYISNENRRAYGEGFLDGFRKAKDLLRAMEPSKERRWFTIPMSDLDNLGEEELEK